MFLGLHYWSMNWWITFAEEQHKYKCTLWRSFSILGKFPSNACTLFWRPYKINNMNHSLNQMERATMILAEFTFIRADFLGCAFKLHFNSLHRAWVNISNHGLCTEKKKNSYCGITDSLNKAREFSRSRRKKIGKCTV